MSDMRSPDFDASQLIGARGVLCPSNRVVRFEGADETKMEALIESRRSMTVFVGSEDLARIPNLAQHLYNITLLNRSVGIGTDIDLHQERRPWYVSPDNGDGDDEGDISDPEDDGGFNFYNQF